MRIADKFTYSPAPEPEEAEPVAEVELGPPAENALEYFQAIYRDPTLPRHVRMMAARVAIPFESPKLAVVGNAGFNAGFAAQLEAAIARQTGRLIEGTVEGTVVEPTPKASE